MARRNRHSGFTVVELLIVLGIIGILAAIGSANILANLPTYRLRGVMRELVSNFQRAKLEAMKRNTDVLIHYLPGTGEAAGYRVCLCPDPRVSFRCYDRLAPIDLALNNPSNALLFEVHLPEEITLVLEAGQPEVVGFTPKALPVKYRPVGFVKLHNNQSLYYQAAFSLTGFVSLKTSRDNLIYE